MLKYYLCRYASQKQPFLLGICAIIDDLAARETRVAVEHLYWLRLPFHAPVVDSVVGDQCDRVQRDPLPKGDIVSHGVRLHFALHFNVKDL